MYDRTMESPVLTVGAPGPCGRSTMMSLPLPVPEVTRTPASPHGWSPVLALGIPSGLGGQGISSTDVTVPYARCSLPALPGGGGTRPGHNTTRPTTVATMHGITIAKTIRLVRAETAVLVRP